MDDPSGRVFFRLEFRAFWRFLDIFLQILTIRALWLPRMTKPPSGRS